MIFQTRFLLPLVWLMYLIFHSSEDLNEMVPNNTQSQYP